MSYRQLFSLGRSPGISKEGGFQYSHESVLPSQYSLGTWYIMGVRQQFSLLATSCSPRQVKSITLFSSCSPSLLPACLPSVMAQGGRSINFGKLESTSFITRVRLDLVGVASANRIL